MPLGQTENNDVIRVACRCSLAAAEVDNIHYYKCSLATAQDDVDVMDAIAAHLDTAYAYFVPQQANDIIYEDIHFYNITQARPMGTLDWPTLVDGDITAYTPMPNGVAGLVTADTWYKKSRPKKFIAGFTEDKVDANTWIAAVVTALTNFMDDWLEDITISTGNVLTPGTWSKTYNLFRALVSVVARSKVAYQRARKPA